MPEDESAIPKRAAERKPREPEYIWQHERLKPQSERLPGASLVKGYGPQGKHSMYLPSPKVERRITFKDGSPQIEVTSSCLEIPAIADARNAVLKAQAGDAMRLIFADASIAHYSSLLLRTQYNLTDEDLTFLHSGGAWIEPVARHALGGDDAVEALRKIDPSRFARLPDIAETMPPAPDDSPVIFNAPLEVADDVASAVASGELVDAPAFYRRDDRGEVDLSSD